VLTVTFADLRFRYRQFLIAVVGAGVVLAMAILMSGLAAGFRAEIHRTVGAARADAWVMTDKSSGRLTSISTFPASAVSVIRHERNVREAEGFILLPQEVAMVGADPHTVGFIGVVPGHLGAPLVTKGRGLQNRPGEAVADPGAGLAVGDTFRMGAQHFHVVGTVKNRSLDGGMPSVYVGIRDARSVAFGGQDLVTAIVTRGVPQHAPRGLQVVSNSYVEDQTLETLAGATSSIKNSRTLLWIVAAIIVAALIYVSALQRVRDFAVFKALGSSSGRLFASLCLQSIIVTLIAAAFAAGACNFLKAAFSQPVVIPASAFVSLPIVAVGVGLLSSLVALRSATRADPVTAFGA
jgi:putative ABC transport system permease protein